MPRARALRTAATVVLAAVLAVVLVVTVAVVALVRRPLPSYGGEAELPGLTAEVTVLRDDQGIPHIWARDAADLFRAQGYVHAQDRFFEMDYRRHVTAGRLAELVGGDPTAIAADAVVRTMGWRRVAEAEWPLLEQSTRAYLQAYADGVNAYLRGRSPSQLSLTYTVLGVQVDLDQIEPWEPVDSLAWLKSMAWDLRANYRDELARALAYGEVGDIERVNQLFPPYPVDRHLPIVADGGGGEALGAALGPVLDATGTTATGTTATGTAAGAALPPPEVATARSAIAAAADALDAVPVLLGRGDAVGSNSWVVGPELSATGAPLLANDPHLAPRTPSVWYQNGLHCEEPGEACPFAVSGFSFAGFPGVIIGHNADVAWGMTSMGADVTDFFLESVGGGTYLRDGEQVPLETRTETIAVAGEDPVQITVRETVHGPLLSGVLEAVDLVGARAPVPNGSPIQGTGYEVALAWTALEPGRTADAVFGLNRATGWRDFREAARSFEVPAQNLLYADTEGRIGYQAPGRVPVRPAGTGLGQQDGTWPRLGWSSGWDWQGYVPFEELPSLLDPSEGFVVAANQAVSDAPAPFLTADWEYGYRSQRIRALLEEAAAQGRTLTAEDMAAMQLDDLNPLAAVLVPALRAQRLTAGESLTAEEADFTREAVEMLHDWDGRQGRDSAPAAYFNAVWARVLDLTFTDELSSGQTRPDGGDRWFEVVRLLLSDPENSWWDDQTTPTVIENRDQILTQALVDARVELTAALGKDPRRWEWGKLHQLDLRAEPLGAEVMPTPVRAFVNPDPMDLGGGPGIVDAVAWDAGTTPVTYDVTTVPSMRMVVDLSDLDASTWVDLTGVSGHPASSHYGDQTGAWTRGEQFPWPFSRAAVEEAADDELLLRPDPGGEG